MLERIATTSLINIRCVMAKRVLLMATCFLAACATGPRFDTTYTAKSQDSRVQFIIIHFTSTGFDSSLKILTQGPVSSHYLVSDDPKPVVYQLVDETRRAYHAGQSYWKGHTHINASSIGIEIVNRGYRNTPEGRVWEGYPPAQVDAVIDLVKTIAAKHDVRPDRILGHSDIAPQRKEDPGPMFPWKRLADAGLIVWPDAAQVAQRRTAFEQKLPDVAWFKEKLALHGFAVPGYDMPAAEGLDAATRRVISAFQMRYRPAQHDGTPDAETAAILDTLTSMAPPAAQPEQ